MWNREQIRMSMNINEYNSIRGIPIVPTRSIWAASGGTMIICIIFYFFYGGFLAFSVFGTFFLGKLFVSYMLR